VLQDSIAELTAALVRQGNEQDGKDLGVFLGFEESGVKITSNMAAFLNSCDAVIDFSSPALSLEIAEKCAATKKVLVCGTTGFSDAEKQKFGIVENYSKKLEWDLKKEKVKGKFKSILGTGVIAVLTFFLITK